MGITDLFRPKWKHSDAEVRAAAVRSLSSTEADTLASVARNDADAAVRRIAIKKLSDAQLLSAIASSDPDENLRQLAKEKAESLLLAAALAEGDTQTSQAALAQLHDASAIAEVAKSATQETLRRTALERLTDPRELAEVARHAKDPAIRLSALQNLDDQDLLRAVLLAEETKEVALAALERLSDREALEAVAKKHRLKSLRSRAQRKLKDTAPKESAPQRIEPTASEKLQPNPLQPNQLEQICRTVETLARSSNWGDAAQKIAAAQETWQKIAPEADTELRRRFDSACADFFARYQQHKEDQAARAQTEEALQQQLAERAALCEQVETLEGTTDLEALAPLLARWQALAPLPAAQQAVIEQRFARACQAVERRQAEKQKQQAQHAQLEQLCAEAEQLARADKVTPALLKLRELRSRWQELARRQEVPPELQGRLEQAQKQLEERAAQQAAAHEQRLQQNLERQEALCKQVEELTGSDDLKQVDRLQKEVQAALRKPERLPTKEQEDAVYQRLLAGREQLAFRIQELRQTEDWKRWANVPKLEALCEQATALLKEPDLGQAAARLRQIQAEWRKVGSVPKDKSRPLWEGFKATCDQVYARCKEHLDQQEEQRQQNLKQKQALCEQVEALAESTAWETTAEEIKRLQAEWKTSGSVPRKQSDAVWKRFRKACDTFFERRKEHLDQQGGERHENLSKKETLCERVEALAESTEWEVTAAQIKRLQAEWKAIGPVPRKSSDAVWKRFRKACDTFFTRREEQQLQALTANLAHKEALAARLEALNSTPAGDEQAAQDEAAQDEAAWQDILVITGEMAVEAVNAARSEWKSIGPVPPARTDEVWDRFNAACAALALAHPESFKGSDLDPEAGLRRLEQLVRQAESFVEHEPETPTVAAEAETVAQMAERLRQALQANALSFPSDSATVDWRLAADEIKHLQSELKRVGPVSPERAAPLLARFRAACRKVLAHSREEDSAEDERRQQNLKLKQELCDQAVKLASSSTPAAHLALIESLAREWERLGPVPRGKGKPLWNRFRTACTTVRQAANPPAAEAAPAAPEFESAAEVSAPAPEATGADNASPHPAPSDTPPVPDQSNPEPNG